MAIKIYTTKSCITRRLRKSVIKKIAKPTLDSIGVMIEIDDNISSIDRTQRLLEQKTGEFLKLGVDQIQINKVLEKAQEVAAERDYLIRLYHNSCGGGSWNNKSKWCSSAALENQWHVYMDNFTEIIDGKLLLKTRRVVKIVLVNNYLHGNYSVQAFGNMPDDIEKLTYLKELYLQYNFLSNFLPSTLGNLCNLKILHLEFNQITDALPHLDHMNSLEELYLNHNHLEDSIIELIKPKKLKKCHIYHNKFSGKVSEELADKKDLTSFKFYNNYMQIGSKVQPRHQKRYRLAGYYRLGKFDTYCL